MEIREVGEKLTKSFKGNGKYIALALGGVGLLILMTSRTSTEDSGEWVTPTGYTSYPDAVTNANVIMGEVNNHTTAEIAGLKDNLDVKFENVDTQFEITNNYVQEGINKVIENANANKDQVVNQIVTSEGNIIKEEKNTQSALETVNKNVTNVNNNILNVGTKVDSVGKKVDSVGKKVDSVSKKVSTSTAKKTSAKKSSSGQTKVSTATKYYKKATYKGNSLVDALKSIGVTSLNGLNVSNWKSRKALAKANGISNYTGTAKQNTKLLNLLKKGKLKKA